MDEGIYELEKLLWTTDPDDLLTLKIGDKEIHVTAYELLDILKEMKKRGIIEE